MPSHKLPVSVSVSAALYLDLYTGSVVHSQQSVITNQYPGLTCVTNYFYFVTLLE